MPQKEKGKHKFLIKELYLEMIKSPHIQIKENLFDSGSPDSSHIRRTKECGCGNDGGSVGSILGEWNAHFPPWAIFNW